MHSIEARKLSGFKPYHRHESCLWDAVFAYLSFQNVNEVVVMH